MDYSPWSSKNLITWNWLKKFVQVGVDVTCMYTDFGGHSLSSFGDNNFNVGVFFIADFACFNHMDKAGPSGISPKVSIIIIITLLC